MMSKQLVMLCTQVIFIATVSTSSLRGVIASCTHRECFVYGDMEVKLELKVNLYPYLPDLEDDKLRGLAEYVKREFESSNPDISLSVCIDGSWDQYNPKEVAKRLSSEPYDITELDTVILGEVVDEGVAQELDLSKFGRESFLPIPLVAMSYKGADYGVPSL